MKRSTNAKFPNSAQLFKFCQRVLLDQKKAKIHDQEIGSILNFNPSDCSHWKRGEKSVRSVFALEKLSSSLNIENSLVIDVASGQSNINEAFYEYKENSKLKQCIQNAYDYDRTVVEATRKTITKFVNDLHKQCSFETPPLYLPEVFQIFSFIKAQPIEMLDKLSRILRVRQGQYCIQFTKGDLKPQTRMSISMDLARIIFEGERARFPELGSLNADIVAYEEALFVANLLIPSNMLVQEMSKVDVRRNVVAEIANLFWVPKSLVSFQIQEIMRT